MKGEFEVRVVVKRLPLSRVAIRALQQLERYDVIVFTSKHARIFFEQELRSRGISLPRDRVIQVGPRNDLLKKALTGKRILFPRSALAPSDVIRKLRSIHSIVRVVLLYTAEGKPLSHSEKKRLQQGGIQQLYFKSPSGVHGLIRQFRGNARAHILSIPARCIGLTTARAAREAGFVKVFTT
jgi:uroporphyrinogen-III synthase